MFGATGSRHLNSKRRGSSPSIPPQILSFQNRLSVQLENKKEEKNDQSDDDEDDESGHRRRRRTINNDDEHKDIDVDEEDVAVNQTEETESNETKAVTDSVNTRINGGLKPKTHSSTDGPGNLLSLPMSRPRRASTRLGVPRIRRRSSRSRTPTSSRLSITDLPVGVRFARRRAVEISDQKACVLLHSRLKGMKLEDIA